MTFRGSVTNGQIALDEPVELPDGTEVQVDLATRAGDDLTTLLLMHAEKGRILPAELAANHDHDAHGKPNP